MNSHQELLNLKEFSDFLNVTPASVPNTVSSSIKAHAHAQLRKHKGFVFTKLLGIHFVMSLLSLLVCHQFDMNPFGSRFSLSDYFMAFGHSVCMVFCGFLFLGGSLVAARLILIENDFRIIQRSFLLQILILCSLSLGAFMALGAHVTIGMGALWVLGAYVGSGLSLIIPSPQLLAEARK